MRNFNFGETERKSVDARMDKLYLAYSDLYKNWGKRKANNFLIQPDVLLTLAGIKPSTAFSIYLDCKDTIPSCPRYPFDFQTFKNIKKIMDNYFKDELNYIERDVSHCYKSDEKVINFFMYNKEKVLDLLVQDRDMFSHPERVFAFRDLKKFLSNMVHNVDHRIGIVYGYDKDDVKNFIESIELNSKIPYVEAIIGRKDISREMIRDKRWLQILSDYYSKEELSRMDFLLSNRDSAAFFPLENSPDFRGYSHVTWDFLEISPALQNYSDAFDYAFHSFAGPNNEIIVEKE